MKRTSLRTAIRAGLLATALLASPAAFGQTASPSVPTPESVLGHTPGDDYYLADYEDSVSYFKALAAADPARIKLHTAGKTTHGKEMIYAVISSPENIRNYDQIVAVSKQLGAVEGLDDARAKALAEKTPIIVHIDGGMHASEVSDHQLPLALAYKLLSAKDDPEIAAILDNVVLVLWPTLNPDGQDMIVKWYRDHLGTKYETSRMPWLYQEYVGHDNNRDGYMLNMIETRVVNAEEQKYAPVIWYSQHQTAPFPARIWMPPFADPISGNISPLMRIWTNTIGSQMMSRFQHEQKPGAIAMARFDNWYPGFLDYVHVFRNTISFFTETAHDSATPKTSKVEDFPATMRDLKPQIWYPDPWRGGEWHLKDSVDYMVTASMSVLDTATKYRQTLLFNRYQAGRDAMALYAERGPHAYVIPVQTDMPEAASLAQLLISHGLRVEQLKSAATLGGKQYPAGSWVVPMDQPFAGLAKELFEAQSYPDAILAGEGTAADLPYDVTGWTLPMQMNVTVDPITDAIPASAKAKMAPIAAATPPAGTVTGKGSAYLLPREVNNSYRLLNAALAKGAQASFAGGTQGGLDQPIVLTGLDAAGASALAREYAVPVKAVGKAPAGAALGAGKVGLYRPWGSNIDEGWTRWIFEQYGFNPTSLYNKDVQSADLAQYDTIVLPDISGPRGAPPKDAEPKALRGPVKSLVEGISEDDIPAPYAGGIGDAGSEALKKYVADGGTLVALNNSSDAVIELFDLPVTNILKDVSSDEFFCSGALLQIELTPGTAVSPGMAADPIVMFERGPAFAPKDGFTGQVLAKYADEGNPLRSGVLLHPEKIAGAAAAVAVPYGKGTIYLYGFKPQWRGQSHGNYKLLFNLLYNGKSPTAH